MHVISMLYGEKFPHLPQQTLELLLMHLYGRRMQLFQLRGLMAASLTGVYQQAQ